jgi:hypothetical protein
MPGKTHFRFLLPIAETVAAAGFSAAGLWQRHRILNQPGWSEGQTMWNTTARFHVWPWPFKFAVASNIPAFLTSAVVMLPIKQISEWTELALWILFVPPLWYLVGRRLDAERHAMKAWLFLLSFTAASIFCASFPLAYIGYIYMGVPMWIVATFFLMSVIGRSRVPRDEAMGKNE